VGSWFNIERRVRKRIAIGLNLAWICHFAALYTHLRWPEYIHIAWPYLLWHYLPLLLSISFQVPDEDRTSPPPLAPPPIGIAV
jgi:hypothetical protein